MKLIDFTTQFKTFKGEDMRVNDASVVLQKMLELVGQFTHPESTMTKDELTERFKAVMTDNPLLTLRDIALNALSAAVREPDGKEARATVKFRRGLLASRIAKDDVIELSAEDVALLKRLIDEVYPSPLIVFNALLVLDPPTSSELTN